MFSKVLKFKPNYDGIASNSQRHYYRDALGRFATATTESGGKKSLMTRFKDLKNLVAAHNHQRSPKLRDIFGYVLRDIMKGESVFHGFAHILKLDAPTIVVKKKKKF